MFRRTVDGTILDFGTTGALRDSNLLMYDRQTESWWQEFGGEGVIGHYAGTKLEQLYLSIVPRGPISKPLTPTAKRFHGPIPVDAYGQQSHTPATIGRAVEPFLFRWGKRSQGCRPWNG